MKMKNREVCIKQKNKIKRQKKYLNGKEFSDLPDKELLIMVIWILTKVRITQINKVRIQQRHRKYNTSTKQTT